MEISRTKHTLEFYCIKPLFIYTIYNIASLTILSTNVDIISGCLQRCEMGAIKAEIAEWLDRYIL